MMHHVRQCLSNHGRETARDRRGRLGDVVGQRHGETGGDAVERRDGIIDLRGEISAVILKIMHRTAHHRHRIIQRRTQRGEPLRSDRIVRRLGHRPAGLRLHDRAGQQMAHIVVDLPGDTRALAEGRHANRLGAFLIDVGDARTSGPRGFARPVLRVQQRAPRLVRGGAGPAQNESKQGDHRHHQRLETVGATGEPERDRRQQPYPARGDRKPRGRTYCIGKGTARGRGPRDTGGAAACRSPCPSPGSGRGEGRQLCSIVGDERHERAP